MGTFLKSFDTVFFALSYLDKNVPIWAEVNSDGDIRNEWQRKTSFGVDGWDQKEGNNAG